MECVLPTHYFHVVFTLPHEIVALALQNREEIFNLLFSAAARTLLELGKDEEWLGAQLGVTAVLHTWTRDLRFHPHVHCIVTGGGLAPHGDRWISSHQKYLFPGDKGCEFASRMDEAILWGRKPVEVVPRTPRLLPTPLPPVITSVLPRATSKVSLSMMTTSP